MLQIEEQFRDILVNYIGGSMSTTMTIAEAAALTRALSALKPVEKPKPEPEPEPKPKPKTPKRKKKNENVTQGDGASPPQKS